MARRVVLVCLAAAAIVGLAAPEALAGKWDRGTEPLTCDDSDSNGDGRATHCDIRETTLGSFAGSIDVDPGLNGGVSVYGWDQANALIRARVRTNAESDAEAAALAGQVRIEAAGGKVRAEGPPIRDRESWSVTFQVFVPHDSRVSVRTTNGGIALGDLTGVVRFEALNGGVALRSLGGDVRGHTTNGGLSVALNGRQWNGEALDVYTVNGGVNMRIPADYSAQLETGTEHGGLSVDYPVTVVGKVSKQLAVTLGAGGPLVRAVTTNGGVRIQQAE